MSDHATKSYQGTRTTSMPPHCSSWMAHWAGTGGKSTNQTCNNVPVSYESGEGSSQTKKRSLLDAPMPAIDSSKHDTGSGVGADNLHNENLIGRSRKRRKERLDSEPIPMFNGSQHRKGKLALNIEQAAVGQGGALKFKSDSSPKQITSSIDRKEIQSPSLLGSNKGKSEVEYIKSRGLSGYPDQLENSNKFFDNSSLSVPTIVRDDEIMGSASKFMINSRIPLTKYERNMNNQSSSFLSSKKQIGNTNFHSFSTLVVQETKINQLLDPTDSTNQLSRQNMKTFLLHNPSTSNLDEPNLFPIKCVTRRNSSNNLTFPSRSNHSDAARSKHLYHGGYPLRTLPYSVHDVEAMRICTTVNSVGEAFRGPPKFSHTTHRFMITKKTDVLYEPQEFTEATTSNNPKGKAATALLSLPTSYGTCNPEANEIIQPSSPVDGELKNLGNIKTCTACLSNESSAETDIMDMDACQDNHLTGVQSSLADKDLGSLKSPLLSATSPTYSGRKEIGDGLKEKSLPDINEQPPDFSASASMMDNRESSTTKTQSFKLEPLISYTEKQRVLNSTLHLHDSPKQEVGSGWVKRLKPCASESVHDTKNSRKEEASSCDKANLVFNKMKCSSTSSEGSMGQLHGKVLAGVQTAFTAKNKDLYSNFSRENREIVFSNPWIQRWCRDKRRPSESNLQSAAVHKPQFSKSTYDAPFPSIAAMALMGKTATEFQPCEFRKRGSSLIWNTTGI